MDSVQVRLRPGRHLPRQPGHIYPTGNYMYGIIPGYTTGVEGGTAIPAAPKPGGE